MLHTKIFATIVAILFLCVGNTQTPLELSQAKTGFLYPGMVGDFTYDFNFSDDLYCFKNLDWIQRYTNYYGSRIDENSIVLKTPQHFFAKVIKDSRENKRANLILLDFKINVFKPYVFKKRILEKKYNGDIIDHSNGKAELFNEERNAIVGIQLPVDNSATITDLYINPEFFVTNITKKGTYKVVLSNNKSTFSGSVGDYISIPTSILLNSEWTIKVYQGSTLITKLCYGLTGDPYDPSTLDLPPYTTHHVLGLSDQDKDGIPDIYDNCISVSNFFQNDIDGDGIGDACDGDIDGDAIPNDLDNCQYSPNPNQEDSDQDGIGDHCDKDWDNDGIMNWEDNCPNTPNFLQVDSDQDGKGDACDDNIDGDGIPNDQDNCPYISNVKQTDQDNDGIGDLCDDDIDGDGILNEEDNCVYMPNPFQEDSDNDGIGDHCDDLTPDYDETSCRLEPTSEGTFTGSQEFVVGPPGSGADLIVTNQDDLETYLDNGNPSVNKNSKGIINYAIYQNPSRSTITAPIIVVDGFDPAGTRSINGIITIFGGDSKILEFWEQGFDLIIVDFAGGADFMQRNALGLQDFIVDLKEKHNLETIPAIVGPSMGGQIVRYMLLDWEENNTDPLVETFISVDSPWEGANVSPAVQALISKLKFISTTFTTSPTDLVIKFFVNRQKTTILEADMKLNSPAARQMMLNNVNSENFIHPTFNDGIYLVSEPHSLRNQWVSELASKGNVPTNLGSIIATADGSAGSSNGNVAPGVRFFELNNVINVGNLHAIQSGILINGYIDVFSLDNGDFLDSAPGSKFPQDDLESIDGGEFVSSPLSVCFIPTFSALGIQGGFPGMPIVPSGESVEGSPFNKTFFDFNDSDHIAFDNINDGLDDFTFFENNTESNGSTYTQCDHLDNYSSGEIPIVNQDEFVIDCQDSYFNTACINLESEFEDITYTSYHLNGPPLYDVYFNGTSLVMTFTGNTPAYYPATYNLCATVTVEDCTKTVCQSIKIELEEGSCGNLKEDEDADTRSSKEIDEIKSLQIIPNPNNGEFQISNDQEGQVYIIDITGKMVHTQSTNSMNQTLILDLTPGLYFVKFISSDGTEYEVSKVSIH